MSLTHEKLTRNIQLSTVLRPFLASFMLARPAVFPLWEANGFSFNEILKLQIVFSLLILVFEIPSGWLGDRIGRKVTLLIGAVALVLGSTVYGCASSLPHFVVGELLLGLGLAMVSGVDQAVLFESLSALNRSGEFMKRWGWQRTLDLLCSSIWNIIGGYILVENVRLPFFVAAVGYAVCLPLTLGLADTSNRESKRKGASQQLVRDVLFVFRRNRVAVWAFMFLALLAATIGFFTTFTQGYLKVSGVPLSYYGWITAGLTLIGGISSMLTHRVYRWLGLTRCIWFVVLIVVMSLVGSGLSTGWWSWLWLLPLATQKGFAGVLVSQVLNSELLDNVRVTFLSLASLAGRVFSIALMFVIDQIGSAYGARSAFLVVGIVFAGAALPLAIWLTRRAGRWSLQSSSSRGEVPA